MDHPMKTKFIKFLTVTLFTVLSFSLFTSASTYAEVKLLNEEKPNDTSQTTDQSSESYGSNNNCSDILLGLKPWNCGTTEIDSEDALKSNAIIIATNILADLTIIAAYLVLGFVIYGGYQYMFSEGDPGKAAAGKRTLIHAFIGLAIVLSANIILSSIRIAFLGQNGSLTPNADIDANTLVTNLIQWVVGISGLVAAVFLVIGGISYITSTGDANKLQKAKTTILYALIGLVIVALAEIATAFVSNLLRESQKPQSTAQIIIRKEIES